MAAYYIVVYVYHQGETGGWTLPEENLIRVRSLQNGMIFVVLFICYALFAVME